MRSAQYIGVLDSSGYLRCQALIDANAASNGEDGGEGENKNDPPPPPGDKNKNKADPKIDAGFTALPISINARTGRKAILHFQEEMTNEEVGKLIESIKLSFDYKESNGTILPNQQRKEDGQ